MTMRCNEAINAIARNAIETSSKYGSQGRGFFGNIASALLSPFEAGARINRGDGVGKALNDTFTTVNSKTGKPELQMMKVAGGIVGGAFALRAGFGAARGAFTDGQGNFDAPGIPLI